MNSLIRSRIASVVTVALGAWLMLSPLFIAVTGAALISLLVSGGIIVLAGVVQFFWEETLPSWITGLVAVWLLVAAVVFNMDGAALWNQLLVAFATFVAAAWDGIEVDQFQRQHSHA